MPEPRACCRGAAVLLGVALTLSAGCNSRPSAPALKDGPIFKDSREGFRFNVPDGWKQRARGQVPAGPVEGERMLAEYKCVTCAKPAALEVTVATVPAAASLSEYVTKHTLTGEHWRLSAPTEEFTINAQPAVRITYVLRAGKDKDDMVREIVAFRRGERVYFFKGFYATSDSKSRKEIRAAVDSVVW